MDNVLFKIVKGCLRLEEIAYETYSDIARNARDIELADFFRNMAIEESEHIQFWKRVEELVESSAMGNIIDREDDLLDDVSKTIDIAEIIRSQIKDANDNRTIFVLTFYLETYVMRPAVGLIFQYVKNISAIKNPIDTYQIHLEKFINMFKRQHLDSIEVTSVANIIFQLYRENVELSRLSYVDILSGLLNRRGLFSAMYTIGYILSRNGGGTGLIMIDIDNFKKANDMYGHLIGDQIISTVGTIIKSCIRNSDIAGRYGGEEFLIFLPDIKMEKIKRVAENIRSKVETEFEIRFPITISVGCAYFEKLNTPYEDINNLIKKADENLYLSKSEGKNRVTFKP